MEKPGLKNHVIVAPGIKNNFLPHWQKVER